MSVNRSACTATSVAFDTHGAVKRLEQAGFQAPQSEAITETVRLMGEAHRGELATKPGLLELEGRVETSMREMEGRLNQSTHDLESCMTRTPYSALVAVVALTTGLTVALIKLI